MALIDVIEHMNIKQRVKQLYLRDTHYRWLG